MPSITPIFELPYPAPSDAPCDFAEQWCDFTQAIDTVLLTFERGLARTVPTIPMAILRQTQIVSVPNVAPMPFDAVVVDTDNMTDIDVDPYSIIIRRPGRYSINAYTLHPGTALTDTQNAFITSADSFTSVFASINLGLGPSYKLTNSLPVATLTAGETVRMSFNTGVAGNYNVQDYWLSVAWHSDRQVP
jgi:hypothetical protein